MAAKRRRTFYNRVKRRVADIYEGRADFNERKLIKVYNYLWWRLKREITEKMVGI